MLVRLVDAFENSQVAQKSVGLDPRGFCSIGGDAVDCDKAGNFITEHMTN
jgi:hypothetical protein